MRAAVAARTDNLHVVAAVSEAPDARVDLLHRYGRWYGQQHFAVAFTAATDGDDAKRVTQRGWDKTVPLADGDYGEALVVGRGAGRNPVIVVRPSNLVVLECDSEPDLARLSELNLPKTVTVVSSAPYKRHLYFRPDPTIEQLPAVAFRFESGRLTQDTGRYFLCPPAIHPSGRVYSFLAGHGPDDIPIAVLPADLYRRLIAEAHRDDTDQAEAILFDASAKIQAGQRREFLFRYACMLRRWGHSQTEIEALCLAMNNARCEPPVAANFVRVQVEGAMKKHGGQELTVAAEADTIVRTIRPVSAKDLCAIPDNPLAELVGPIVQTAGRTIIVGQTGEGKTTLALQLVRAVLSGDQFLDWHGVGAGSALIVDLEQGARSVKRALRDARLHDRTDVDLALVPDGLALDRELDHVNELDEAIGAGGYTIVVLDPFYKAHQADDPNAERPIVDLMRILDALRAKHGFALILPAHPRKEPPGNSGFRKLTIADVAGSSAITRGAEIVIGIERVTTGYARLRFLKDRDGDLPIGEAMNLLYNRETGYMRDPRDLEPERDYRTEILTAGDDMEWRTIGEWKDAVHAGQDTLKPILNQLAKEGVVVYAEGPPGRGRTAKCWKLSQDSAREALQMASTSQVTQHEGSQTGQQDSENQSEQGNTSSNEVTSASQVPPGNPRYPEAETATYLAYPTYIGGKPEVSETADTPDPQVTDDPDADIPW